MTDHATRDSFIVQLQSAGQGATMAEVRGRIEHVQSQQSTRFIGVTTMLRFIEEHLGVRQEAETL